MDDAKIGEILRPGDDRENTRREQSVRRRFWRTLKKAAGRIPFVEELVASYYCALDRETPTRVRAILLAALFYFVLPFDLIPDFLAVFGFTDDVAVLAAALSAVRAHIKPGHYDAARRALDNDKQ